MTVNAANIAVFVTSQDSQRRTIADELAQRLGLAIVDDTAQSAVELFLTVTDERLELRDRARGTKGVAVDFGQLDSRTLAGTASRKQPILRAFGSDVRTIVDATAGLGQDAALLACMGYQVTALERSPIVAALLEDGFRRAMDDDRLREPLHKRLTIVPADAREFLRTTIDRPDAVYLDPMFPPKRKKSALAPRSIRLVRTVVGDDDDAADLLALAITTAKQRVVVKRPSHAPPLGDLKPTMSYEGKLARFDVYRI